MPPRVKQYAQEEAMAVIASEALLRRMVETGHIWPKTMAEWIQRHGYPECLRPARVKPPAPRPIKTGRPKGAHARNRRRDARDYGDTAIRVLNHVSERENVSVEELRGHCLTKRLTAPRRRAVRIMRRLGMSLNAIAAAMNRDRASVLNSLNPKARGHR